MLPFLFRFQIQSRHSAQILFAHRLINGGSTTNSLTIIMRRICPPVRFRLHVTQNHILDRRRQSRNFPWNVRLPASPSFRQMLKNGSRFVLFDAFRHHVQNVVHDRGTKLQIVVRFYALFGHRFCDPFRMTTFELTRQQVAQPTFQQWDDSTQEKQPYSPSWSPNSTTGSFADWPLKTEKNNKKFFNIKIVKKLQYKSLHIHFMTKNHRIRL